MASEPLFLFRFFFRPCFSVGSLLAVFGSMTALDGPTLPCSRARFFDVGAGLEGSSEGVGIPVIGSSFITTSLVLDSAMLSFDFGMTSLGSENTALYVFRVSRESTLKSCGSTRSIRRTSTEDERFSISCCQRVGHILG